MFFICFSLAGIALVKAQSSASSDAEKKEATVTATTVDGSTNATVSTDADSKTHKCTDESKKCCKKSKMSCCKKAKAGCNGKKEDAPAGAQ